MRTTVADIVRETAAKHRLTVAQLLGPCRERRYVWARQAAMFEAYVRCPHASYPAIGRVMGGLHHTTVLHGVKSYCKRSGLNYSQVRRAFAKDTHGKTRPAPSSASEYRAITRLFHAL